MAADSLVQAEDEFVYTISCDMIGLHKTQINLLWPVRG